MILRRLKAHIEKENWFAVFLDFCIVVIGVFIGIQVANWNEARALQAQERSYLVLVHEELTQNAERAARLLEYYTTVTEAGERALDYLKDDEACEADYDDQLIDFFHASQLWGISFDQSAFHEAIELGFPSDNSLREELSVTYDFMNSFGLINQVSPPFRETVREYIEPDAARILWEGCWEVDVTAVTEQLTRDCAGQLEAIDTAGMLREIKSDERLLGMLRYWVNHNIVAMQNYPTVRDRTIAAAEMVAAEIEKVQ